MTIKTIAVPFDSTHGSSTLAKAAAELARLKGAHLTGTYALPDYGEYRMGLNHIPREVFSEIRANHRREADDVHNTFADAASIAGVQFDWIQPEGYAGDTSTRMLEVARAADLIVMRQADSKMGEPGFLQNDFIRGSGRPVLVVPEEATLEGFGETAVVGWSPTREATRAAFDAAALLGEGGEITLLSVGVDSEELDDGPLNAMAAALDRHGHKVTVTHRGMLRGMSIGKRVLDEASELGASFIAVGAFGHSRIYDTVIGAVTTELLKDAEIPVMFTK